MRYDGGKGVSFPQIINLMPPHGRYVETHLGGGAVMRHKRPAAIQVGIDLDPKVIEIWQQRWPEICDIVHGDSIEYLSKQKLDADTLVYIDPPYHPETRRRSRVYRYDYSIRDHEQLLEFVVSLPCKVILSGYQSPLYNHFLADWSVHRFQARTRVGNREETVWFNYPKPTVLHDDRFLGDGFRERETIRRRQERLRLRVDRLSINEQLSLYRWLEQRLKKEGRS